MTTRQLGMDLVSEDGKKYHVRLEQEGDSPELTFRLFHDCGPLMHVAELKADSFMAFQGRRPLADETGVLFSVEAHNVLRSWVRMILEIVKEGAR